MKGRVIYHNGVGQTIAEMAKAAGVSGNTIRHRLRNDWDLDKALTQPANESYKKTKRSKSDAELYLNETPKAQFPKQLAKLIQNFNGTKNGEYIRRCHRQAFDKWFNDFYLRDGPGDGNPPVLR